MANLFQDFMNASTNIPGAFFLASTGASEASVLDTWMGIDPGTEDAPMSLDDYMKEDPFVVERVIETQKQITMGNANPFLTKYGAAATQEEMDTVFGEYPQVATLGLSVNELDDGLSLATDFIKDSQISQYLSNIQNTAEEMAEMTGDPQSAIDVWNQAGQDVSANMGMPFSGGAFNAVKNAIGSAANKVGDVLKDVFTGIGEAAEFTTAANLAGTEMAASGNVSQTTLRMLNDIENRKAQSADEQDYQQILDIEGDAGIIGLVLSGDGGPTLDLWIQNKIAEGELSPGVLDGLHAKEVADRNALDPNELERTASQAPRTVPQTTESPYPAGFGDATGMDTSMSDPETRVPPRQIEKPKSITDAIEAKDIFERESARQKLLEEQFPQGYWGPKDETGRRKWMPFGDQEGVTLPMLQTSDGVDPVTGEPINLRDAGTLHLDEQTGSFYLEPEQKKTGIPEADVKAKPVGFPGDVSAVPGTTEKGFIGTSADLLDYILEGGDVQWTVYPEAAGGDPVHYNLRDWTEVYGDRSLGKFLFEAYGSGLQYDTDEEEWVNMDGPAKSDKELTKLWSDYGAGASLQTLTFDDMSPQEKREVSWTDLARQAFNRTQASTDAAAREEFNANARYAQWTYDLQRPWGARVETDALWDEARRQNLMPSSSEFGDTIDPGKYDAKTTSLIEDDFGQWAKEYFADPKAAITGPEFRMNVEELADLAGRYSGMTMEQIGQTLLQDGTMVGKNSQEMEDYYDWYHQLRGDIGETRVPTLTALYMAGPNLDKYQRSKMIGAHQNLYNTFKAFDPNMDALSFMRMMIPTYDQRVEAQNRAAGISSWDIDPQV